MVIYIPTEKYKYMVIIESDTILQDITSPENTKVQYTKRYTKAERCSRAARGPREPIRRRAGRKSYGDVQASVVF